MIVPLSKPYNKKAFVEDSFGLILTYLLALNPEK